MASAQTLTDHAQIQEWAEARRAQPACVKGTGGKNDVGMIRLDFPGYSGAESLKKISWDEWFQRFDDSRLALVVQDKTARGQKSNFNKLVARGGDRSTRSGSGGRSASSRGRGAAGAGKRKTTGSAAGTGNRKTTAAGAGNRKTAGSSAGARSRKTSAARVAGTRNRKTTSSRGRTARAGKGGSTRSASRSSAGKKR
jgi:hypothetical protein